MELPIQRTSYPSASTIEHMGINHRSFDIFVTKQFLDGADVVAILQEVSSEGMAEGVTTDPFCDFGTSDGLLKGFLESTFVQVIALP